eukprot:2372442-Heterocapsa_arctica.AAC.1
MSSLGLLAMREEIMITIPSLPTWLPSRLQQSRFMLSPFTYNLGIRQRLRVVVNDIPRAARDALSHFTVAMSSSSRSTG